MTRGFSGNSRITVVVVGVLEGDVSRETFLVQDKKNASRDGLFLRVGIGGTSKWRKKL
jgi:hypothetical protein